MMKACRNPGRNEARQIEQRWPCSRTACWTQWQHWGPSRRGSGGRRAWRLTWHRWYQCWQTVRVFSSGKISYVKVIKSVALPTSPQSFSEIKQSIANQWRSQVGPKKPMAVVGDGGGRWPLSIYYKKPHRNYKAAYHHAGLKYHNPILIFPGIFPGAFPGAIGPHSYQERAVAHTRPSVAWS